MAQLNAQLEIRGGGGILVRIADQGGMEVLLVYRKRFDDWSLPKGKTKGHENDQEAALREVQEETGLQCCVVAEVGATHYRDRRGRARVVRYWLMTAAEEANMSFDNEIDDARWFTFLRAASVATRSGDRDLLEQLSVTISVRDGGLAVSRMVDVWEAQ